jgi:hypothetical protein
VFKALAQLTSSFVGECNSEDIPWAHALDLNQIGNAVGYRARFSGAGARKYQEWTILMKDGFLLRFVQAIEEVICDLSTVFVWGIKEHKFSLSGANTCLHFKDAGAFGRIEVSEYRYHFAELC